MRRVSPLESNVTRILTQRAVNHIRMQMSTRFKALAIVAHRPEERSLDIIAVFCEVEIVTNALCCLWVNGQTPFLAAFAYHPQGIVATVHVEVPHFQSSNLCT